MPICNLRNLDAKKKLRPNKKIKITYGKSPNNRLNNIRYFLGYIAYARLSLRAANIESSDV